MFSIADKTSFDGLHIVNDFKKTYLLPSISSVVMGAGAYGVYRLFDYALGFIIESDYFVNIFSTMLAAGAGVCIYFVVLIKSGGASKEDIMRFPKGASIVRILKKVRIL